MREWPRFKASGGLTRTVDSIRELEYWTRILDVVYEGGIDGWDYQWEQACWASGALFVCPYRNLVSNIGFGPEATHTRSPHHPLANMPRESVGTLQHPPRVARDRDADRREFQMRLRKNRTESSVVERLSNSYRRLRDSRVLSRL